MSYFIGTQTLSETAGQYICLSLKKTNDRDGVFKNTVQWVYVNKSKWKEEELPTKAYVFYRQNLNNGVHEDLIEFHKNLSPVYTSDVYHVLEIPTQQVDTPVVILLFGKDPYKAIDLRISEHVVKTCPQKVNPPLRNDKEFYALCRGLDRTNNAFNLESLMGFFLAYMNLSTDYLAIEKSFGYDQNTNDPFLIYKPVSGTSAISLNASYERVRDAISDFAFIKMSSRDSVGLVTSINRIRYNKTEMVRSDAQDICLLDRLRANVAQFVALNSTNIPGSYSEAERRFITDTAGSIKENALLFINIIHSVDSWYLLGTGVLKFNDNLSYDIQKYRLKNNPTVRSDEAIKYFVDLYKYVYRR